MGEILPLLSTLIESLSISRRLPQIEMAMDDERCVLILRILDPLGSDDGRRLLAPLRKGRPRLLSANLGGPETVRPLGEAVDLRYELPAYAVTLGFLPGDFAQVNTDINRKMIDHAVQLLDPQDRRRCPRPVLRDRQFHAADRAPLPAVVGVRVMPAWSNALDATPKAMPLRMPNSSPRICTASCRPNPG